MRRRWIGAALIGAMILATVAVWGALPDRIPTHWNVRGEVDGWAPRWPAAFLTPGIALALWLLLPLLRRLDPRRAHYERFEETFHLFINIVVGYMAVIHALVIASALGSSVDVSRVMMAMLAVTFIVIGNVLPRLRSNWWLGIRTPWTLESERVWKETHRVGGWTFVVGGTLALLAQLLPPPWRFGVALATLMGGGMIPVAWSYIVWRRHGPEGREA